LAIKALNEGGWILAADTEESGYGKIAVPKIQAHMVEGDHAGAIAIAGAGTGSHIDSMSQKVGDLFAGKVESWTEDTRGEALEKEIHTFYRKNIIPFGRFPVNHIPNVDVLVASSFWTPALWPSSLQHR
jgi:hypothetical protein